MTSTTNAVDTAKTLAAQNAGLVKTAVLMIASDPEMVAAVANGTAHQIIGTKMAEAFARIHDHEECLIAAVRDNRNGIADRFADHIQRRILASC